MYCSNCSANLSSNAKFCATCGKPVNEETEDFKPKHRTTKHLQCPNCKGYKVVVAETLGEFFFGIIVMLGILVLIFGAVAQAAAIVIIGVVLIVVGWMLSTGPIKKVRCTICGFRWEVE